MQNLTPIEYQNQRILITQQLADFYETTTDHIKQNFNNNKEHYQKNVDYFCLEGEEKREFLNRYKISTGLNAKYFYLWTEYGALLHAKSLGTDKAWKVYRILVDTYFRAKALSTPPSPSIPNAKTLELEAKINNSRARIARELAKIADKPEVTTEYKKVIYSRATEILTGKLLLPLPVAEKKTYSATEIGEMLGVSSQRIGLLTNQNNLKTEQYGKLFYDKAKHSHKQVETWRYYEEVIPVLKSLIAEMKGA